MPGDNRGSIVVILVILFSVGYARPQEIPPDQRKGRLEQAVVLIGTVDCPSGKVHFAAGMAGEKDFSSIGLAASALKSAGYPESGVASLGSILEAVCANRGKGPSDGESTKTHSSSLPDLEAHISNRVTYVMFWERGTSIDFVVRGVEIVEIKNDPKASWTTTFEYREGKKGCWQVTTKPPCFKCPDGTGFCISASLAK